MADSAAAVLQHRADSLDALNLYLVSTDKLETIWPLVEGLIEEGAATVGLYGAETVKPLLERGEWQLWVIGNEKVECIVITEIQKYPRAMVLNIRGLAGHNRDRWMHHLETIEAWGAERGCNRVRAVGRPGLEKMLNDYRKVQVYMEKTL